MNESRRVEREGLERRNPSAVWAGVGMAANAGLAGTAMVVASPMVRDAKIFPNRMNTPSGQRGVIDRSITLPAVGDAVVVERGSIVDSVVAHAVMERQQSGKKR